MWSSELHTNESYIHILEKSIQVWVGYDHILRRKKLGEVIYNETFMELICEKSFPQASVLKDARVITHTGAYIK